MTKVYIMVDNTTHNKTMSRENIKEGMIHSNNRFPDYCLRIVLDSPASLLFKVFMVVYFSKLCQMTFSTNKESLSRLKPFTPLQPNVDENDLGKIMKNLLV